MRDSEKRVAAGVDGALQAIGLLRGLIPQIADAGNLVVDVLQSGGKVLTAGNGGSAAEAMHMAEELSGRYKADRRSLAAVSLVADGTALTCIGNDYGFESIFSRQVEGLGSAGDLLVLFSTSGSSDNISKALAAARVAGLRVLSILGRDGGDIKGLSDVEVIVPHWETAHIQEAHQVILHQMLELVELAFCEEKE